MTTHTTLLSCVTRYNLITFRWHKYNNITVSIVRSLLVSGWVTRTVLRMACMTCIHFFQRTTLLIQFLTARNVNELFIYLFYSNSLKILSTRMLSRILLSSRLLHKKKLITKITFTHQTDWPRQTVGYYSDIFFLF